MQTYNVVKFMVKVRLMEKSVKSHVGRVMVQKVITQYNALGTTWKKKQNNHPIHPAMVDGVGGDESGGGGRWEAAMPVPPDKLAVMAGALAASEKAEE